MRKWAKRSFVPSADNGFYPRFWRAAPVAAVAAVALLAAAASYVAPLLPARGSFLSAVLPGVVVSLTNEERAELALAPLAENQALSAAAKAKAEDMAARGYFAHVTPEGLSPWHWVRQAGYSYERAGENLAVNFTDSEDVVDAWMRSPSHRANIVKAGYSEIGVAMAKGRYQGRSAIYVVQFFGAPKGGLPAANVATVPTTTPAASGTAAEGVATGTPAAVASGTPEVAGAAIDLSETVTSFAASPRSSARAIIWALLGLVAAALALAVFVKPRVQFRAIVVTGLALLAALGGFLYWDSRARTADSLLGGESATSTDDAR